MADPPKQFRVDTAGAPLAKWGKICNWSSRDDAMLMLGVHWCGPCPQQHLKQLDLDIATFLAADVSHFGV